MKRFKNIIYASAPGLTSAAALERAVLLAQNNQARLTVVEVIDEIPPTANLRSCAISPNELQENIVTEHRRGLEELVAPWRESVEMTIKILAGIPFLEIIREVLSDNCDLVIKSAESSGLFDRVFGSDEMHLLRKCPCPVWLVKSISPKVFQRILVAVDIDDYHHTKELEAKHRLNLQILEMASALALSESAELHVAHVWEAIGEDTLRGSADRPVGEVDAYVEDLRQQRASHLAVLIDETMARLGRNIKIQSHLPKGSPRWEIPALASKIEADLVVMGTVARTGISGFVMGNTAETILNQINCSVLAIKPPGFLTPVVLVR